MDGRGVGHVCGGNAPRDCPPNVRSSPVWLALAVVVGPGYLSSPSGHPEAYDTLRRSLPEVERLRTLHEAVPVSCTEEVQVHVEQWCKERMTTGSTRSQLEGDDLGTRLRALPAELVDDSLEVIEFFCSLRLEQAPASATGAVHEALSAEVQGLCRSTQVGWTRHVEPNRGEFSQTQEVRQLLMD